MVSFRRQNDADDARAIVQEYQLQRAGAADATATEGTGGGELAMANADAELNHRCSP